MPKGFVYVDEVIPDIIVDLRYTGTNNFLGSPVTGYKGSRAILTEPAAKALGKVQEDLKNSGYCIKIFDAYRPQRAVDHFIKWSRDKADTLMKRDFYPKLPKDQLFRLGYIATKSGHSRGSTVDLSLVEAESGEPVDMGGSYDFFGEISHHSSTQVSEKQKENRELLRKTMRKYGFFSYSQEWWHYTFRPEMFPNTYFDFVVE
ncbi:M15 family metallopeptidase [Antarcticibacterium sp. 1MA-6-2]|uniref:M15 family metallopeptidase n=1 Tax=Antarcticibacterium sp. 1MA-6-2 TaxID=2908210 RepID=UPI001F2404BB|nr:M15 family metallopeptidase [Antarcticibacterium sp. 1MA-6-2]UJH91040.1 M15 family metallopeptidase [Antarcticibacterium sp. 1MA-6-2]